jgi:exosortase E/protease (VPEID-CTERM system)
VLFEFSVLPTLSTSHPIPSALTNRARTLSFGSLPRFLVLAILFAAELLLITVWLDNATLISRGGLLALVGLWGAWTVRAMVGFAALFVTFAYLKNKLALNQWSDEVRQVSVSKTLLLGHVLAMTAFAALSWALYGNHLASLPISLITPLWLVAGLSGIAFAACAFVPLVLWTRLLRATGFMWTYTLLAVLSACVVGSYSQSLWAPSGRLTFALVQAILSLFVTGIVSDPSTMTLGTAKFSVQISPQCSGFEGAGLILAFGLTWLWVFRKECRFPQAWLLLPAGVTAIYLLNAVRIAALILIGNAGAEQIAVGGFHSQAGWMAFTAVAVGLSIAATRISWLSVSKASVSTASVSKSSAAENPTVTYLLPLVSILAAGMLTGAATGSFEWLYPVRFLAAAGVFWTLRKKYASIDWSFTWFGPAIGALVFVIWIAADRFLSVASPDAMPQALADSSATARLTWITLRALSAVVTVPIAEELAFRGFLLRRIISPDFESVPFYRFTWLGLGASSVAFGFLHGNLWFAGILAGLLYAWAMLRRGRIGEAVVAHATTNLLLAAYVLLFQQWHLW